MLFYVPYHTILYENLLPLVLKLCSSVDYYIIPSLHPPFARRPAKQTRSTFTLSPFNPSHPSHPSHPRLRLRLRLQLLNFPTYSPPPPILFLHTQSFSFCVCSLHYRLLTPPPQRPLRDHVSFLDKPSRQAAKLLYLRCIRLSLGLDIRAIMEGYLLVPPERSAIIGRAVWKVCFL